MAGLTNAHVDAGTGFAYPNSQGANWSAKASWAAWTKWDANPYTSIEYAHQIDAGKKTPMLPMVTVIPGDNTLYTVSESHTDDDVSWSSYAAIGVVFNARHVRIKVVATGNYPILQDVGISVMTERRQEIINDLDTSTLTGAYRIGVGDIRLNKGTLNIITGVQITFNGLDASYRYELIDKDAVTGPRVRIYDITTWAHQPADCVIDAIITGA
jgi:hypothetical protein